MTTISNNNIAHGIYLALKEQNFSEQFFPKIIQFLSRKRLLSKSSDILARLDKIINEKNERISVKVSSKNKLDEKIKKELTEILAKRYSAKEVVLIENFDEKLLGGFKIEVNDEVIDLTIKNRVRELQKFLTSRT